MPTHQLLKGIYKESSRTFRDRLKNTSEPHPLYTNTALYRTPSKPSMFHHCWQGVPGGHQDIKETMYICVNDPSLNRNFGKYQLPHIWDQVLQDTPALQLKYHTCTIPHTWAKLSLLQQMCQGHLQLHLVSIVPCGVAFLFTLNVAIIPPHTLNIPNSPTPPFQWCHHW